jgi:hypothetical protein
MYHKSLGYYGLYPHIGGAVEGSINISEPQEVCYTISMMVNLQ